MDLVAEFRFVMQAILKFNFTVPHDCCVRNTESEYRNINILPCSYITLQWILKSLYSFATKQRALIISLIVLLCVHAVSVYAYTKIFEY